jgi:hypothetical protein
VLGSLDVLLPMVEEEEMSPNEYYEFVNQAKKKTRKRATSKSKSRDDNTNKSTESAW